MNHGTKTHDNPVGIVLAGLVSGLTVMIMTVAYAALIFSGEMAAHLLKGVVMGLAAVCVAGLIISLFSQYRLMLSQVDDDTAPVFALLVSLVLATLPASASEMEIFASVVVAVVLATLVTGIGLALFGALNVGAFVQYLPYPVLGGYFAAVGWLLLVGAMALVTEQQPGVYYDAGKLLEPARLGQWLPAPALALCLFLLKRWISGNWLLLGTCLVATALFYGSYWLLEQTPQELLGQGLLIGPFGDTAGGLFNPVSLAQLQSADIGAVLMNSGSIGTILLISAISMMFCVSGISMTAGQDIDINRELRVVGGANIASALVGGMAALPSLSLSRLASQSGAPQSRLVGVISAATCLLIFYVGLPALAYTPKFILAGILIYIGMGFLREWLIDGWYKFELPEYLVIPVILAASIFAGFLVGVLVGLLAAIGLFVIKYSRTVVIRYQFSGSQFHSNVERDARSSDYLREHGNHIMVLGLQGYIFFGTAGILCRSVLDKIYVRDRSRPKYIVLDFAQVTGADASAAANLHKMALLSAEQNIMLIVTALEPQLAERLGRGGFHPDQLPSISYQPDLERGVEWCENRMLEDCGDQSDNDTDIFAEIGGYLPSAEQTTLLKTYLRKMEVPAGFELAVEGAESSELFFLEDCSASAFIRGAGGKPHRVRRSGRGTVYGEIGFFLDKPRSATVITDEAGTLYVLTKKALESLEQKHPELAAGLGRYTARLLTERLLLTTQALQAALK